MKKNIRALSGLRYVKEQDYFDVSVEIYDWVHSHAQADGRGISYRINPDAEVDYTGRPVHGIYSLYSGSAGIGFFLLRLYEITGEQKYLEEAKQVMSVLLEKVEGEKFYLDKLKSAPVSDLPITGWHTGIYSGPAGAGVFALALYGLVKDERYLEFAGKLGDDIVRASKEDETGKYLTEDVDVFSDGGFVLYFISLYKTTKEAKYLELAREYAKHIWGKKIIYDGGSREAGEQDFGCYYVANEIEKVGMPEGSIYTGFAHGSAGIGFLFAVLYELDRQEWELTASKEVARFLQEISDAYGEGRLIPYVWGPGGVGDYEKKYYLGFCHGPAGTSFLYRKLYEITGEESYKEFCEALAKGILEAGAPELNSWGLWNSHCTCCGTPGLIEYFVEMHEFTGKEEYLEYAKRSAARVIADSSETTVGRCFYGHWDRTDPRDVQTYTGLYIGAAGAGVNLLRLYGALKGKQVTDIWEYGYLHY